MIAETINQFATKPTQTETEEKSTPAPKPTPPKKPQIRKGKDCALGPSFIGSCYTGKPSGMLCYSGGGCSNNQFCCKRTIQSAGKGSTSTTKINYPYCAGPYLVNGPYDRTYCKNGCTGVSRKAKCK